MSTVTIVPHVPAALFWSGWALSSLLMLFLVFDGVTKIIPIAPVIEACAKVGIPANKLPAIGLLLLACTLLYAIPPTRVLGALLLTAYLGGAVAIHVRGGSGAFEIAFAIAFGVLAWLGLALRDPGLLRTLFLRQ
jgi:hypothetical protein